MVREPRTTRSSTWDEVEAGILDFDHAAVVARVERHGDLFAPVLGLAQELPA